MIERPGIDATVACQPQSYGDRTERPPQQLILDAVGAEILADIVDDLLDALGTSAAVYERNGDYAFLGLHPTGWCQRLTPAAGAQGAGTDSQTEQQHIAWCCHGPCRQIAQLAMTLNRTLDLPCQGGIRVYAVPLRAGDEVVGALHFGYRDPATALQQLQPRAGHSGRSVDEPQREATAALPHTAATLDAIKRRLATTAKVIGEIVRRQRVEAALAAEMDFLRLQTALAQVALADLAPESLGPRLLETICSAQGYTTGALWQVTDDLQELVLIAGYGEGMAPFHGFRRPLQAPDSLIARAVHTRRPCMCNHIQTSPFRTGPLTRALGTTALMALPLVNRAGDILGVMTFGDAHDPARFRERDLAQGTVLAHQVAMALENGRLFRQVTQLQEQYRVVTDTLYDAVYVVDRHGRITFANTALERLTGYRKEELLGRDSTQLYVPEDIPRILAYRRAAFRGEYVPPYQQLHVLRKDGQRLPVEISKDTLYLQGRPVGRVIVARDCSERLRLEAQLRQAQRLEALGTLAGGIAHDFNNILGAVLGYTELTLDEVPPGSRAWDNLNHVLAAGQRAQMLVQQILAYSQQTAPARLPVPLQPLVQEVCQLLQATLPATITLALHLDEGAGTVIGDATQLHQVLMNLCTNAAYAMRATGGVLEVHLDSEEVTAALAAQHPALRPGPYVRLRVRDTGHGMAPEVLERIFEPFFTTKGPGEGTGMGLAVVHGIVTNHGGAILVESAPGQGATFTVYLPQSDAAASVAALPAAPAPEGHGHILFVDDDAALAHLGQQMLTRLGYEVSVCTSATAALALFRAAPERFDLVITDQTMPDMTGESLASALRQIRPDIPIILSTGFSQTMTAEKAHALGLDALYMKPWRANELGQIIQRIFRQRAEPRG